MRLATDPRLPDISAPGFRTQLYQLMRTVVQQLNQLTEGSIQAITNSATAAPTAGTYQQGDTIRNSTPTEQGAAASKYVVTGWICTAAGTPGTWLPMRTLTGN